MKKNNYKRLLTVIRLATGFILILVLLFNIFYSQNINPLFNGLVQENREVTVNFLNKIKTLPDFNTQIQEYETIYGPSIRNEVFAADRVRKQTLNDLENMLKTNPQEKDILYSLYLLEKENGNMDKAQTYLEKAKQIDPNVGNSL